MELRKLYRESGGIGTELLYIEELHRLAAYGDLMDY